MTAKQKAFAGMLAIGVACAIVGLIFVLHRHRQTGQAADPNFDTSVPSPAYPDHHPVVCFDEGHRNFHTANGRYRPFAQLARADGYKIRPFSDAFAADTLRDCRVLIIANAKGRKIAGDDGAFAPVEIKAVHDWVASGGALLLITDHFPFGSAVQTLAKEFGVGMSEGVVSDPEF